MACIVLLTGCGLQQQSQQRQQSRQERQESQESQDPRSPWREEEQQQAFYNGYLGLKVSVQNGWHVEQRNTANMTDMPEYSEAKDFLDKETYTDGSSFIELISLENMEDRSHADHGQIVFFAEDYIELLPTLEEYVAVCRVAYETPEDGYDITFVGEEQVSIGGEYYTRLTYLTEDLYDGAIYVEEYNIRMIGNLFFTACLSYSVASTRQYDISDEFEQCFAVDRDSPAQRDALEAAVPVHYYNGYLNLHVTIPADGAYYTVNHSNLTRSWEESEELSDLDIIYYEEDIFTLELVSITSRMAMEERGYAQLELYADGYYRATFEEYMAELQSLLSQQTDAVYSEILRSTATVNDMQYERLTMTAEDYGGIGPMAMEYYVAEVRGLYFIACLAYWADDLESMQNGSRLMVETFRFDGEIYVRI